MSIASGPPIARRRRRVLSAAIAVLVVAAAVVLGHAAPASAHDELVGSDPAAGSTVTVAPAAVTLTFSAAVLADLGGNEVQVDGADGATLTAGDLVVDGTTVTQPISAEASGVVTVTWRVVSQDGHPISGQFAFTVDAPVPSPTPTASASPSPTAGPSASTQASASPAATAVADTASAGGAPIGWFVLAALLVLASGAVVFLLISRTRTR